MRDIPWAGPLESHDAYAERRDAYMDGFKNTLRQKDRAKGGCYLTTVCVEFAGLPANCRELTLLRELRDSYIMGRPDGERSLRVYNLTAPALVQAITGNADASSTISETLRLIRIAVEHVEAGRFADAFELYQDAYCSLVIRFLAGDSGVPGANRTLRALRRARSVEVQSHGSHVTLGRDERDVVG